MEALMEYLGLGRLLSPPENVKGGLLHKMDKVCSESGIYALKTLNPEIMKRPEALNNTICSEKIALALKDTVPVVAAIEMNGRQVQSYRGQYYMVYPWREGKSVFPPDITEIHCKRMGDILGTIHKANVQTEGAVKQDATEEHFDWHTLLKRTDEWLSVFRDKLDCLEKWQLQANAGIKRLSQYQVISHRDLDPKNVLWQEDDPLLIDWEAAGFINLYQEMMETAFYWADDGNGGVNERLFLAFADVYEKHMPLDAVNWQAVFGACYQGALGWLYYNIQRGCGLVTVDEKDRKIGKAQALQTLSILKVQERKNEIAFALIKQRK